MRKILHHLRHESGSKRHPEECDGDQQARESSCKTGEWGCDGSKERKRVEYKSEKVENPSEAPHVKVVCTGGTFAMGADND